MECSAILQNVHKQEFHDSLSRTNLDVQACRIMVISLAVLSSLASFLVFDPIISLTAGCFIWTGALILSSDPGTYETSYSPPVYAPRPWYSYVSPWHWRPRPTVVINPSPTTVRTVHTHDPRPRVAVGTREFHHPPMHTRSVPTHHTAHHTTTPVRHHDSHPRVPVGTRAHRPSIPHHAPPTRTTVHPTRMRSDPHRSAPRVPVGQRRR